MNKRIKLDWHVKFIDNFAKLVQPKTYLELGVYKGWVINRINKLADSSIAVDIDKNAANYLDKKIIFYNMTTEKYYNFIKNKGEFIDLLFIDAAHDYNNLKADFNNYYNLVNDGGYILIHDTFPLNNKHTESGYSGDGYRFIDELIKTEKLEILTIAIPPGLTIVRKKNNYWDLGDKKFTI